MSKELRTFNELNKKEIETLKAIKNVDDIKSIKQIGDEWEDDSEVCVGTEINGIRLGFWWVGSKFVGCLDCANESKKAKKAILEELQNRLEDCEE